MLSGDKPPRPPGPWKRCVVQVLLREKGLSCLEDVFIGLVGDLRGRESSVSKGSRFV